MRAVTSYINGVDLFARQDCSMEMSYLYFVQQAMAAMGLHTEFAALTFLAAIVSSVRQSSTHIRMTTAFGANPYMCSVRELHAATILLLSWLEHMCEALFMPCALFQQQHRR
jgi:hypothetical protein